MRKRTKILADELPLSLESSAPPSSLRERLEQESESRTPATSAETLEAPAKPDESQKEPPPIVSVETLETLSRLHANLNETAEEIARELERAAERMATHLHETAGEITHQSEVLTGDATRRLTELQQSLSEAERNLAYTVERLRRENGRAGWMQTAIIVLALLAGTLGGTAAALLILAWIR